MKLRAVVIEDEELARAHLCKMLRDADVEVVGQGENGLDALSLYESLTPQVLFLDIQMPDMTGMQAAAALENFEPGPRVVFVTGYSEYAVEAFERQAFDYLIKPVLPERLRATLERVQRDVQESKPQAEAAGPGKGLTPLDRLPVRMDYSIKLLRVEEIECAVSKDKRVFVRAGGTEHRTYYTLTQLEELLPSGEFVRIHASAIVRLGLIESINFLGNHSYSVSLSSGLVLPLGRSYYGELQIRFGI